MINSFARLVAARDDCRLVIVGDGELLPLLEKQVSNLHLEERIIFTGKKDTPILYYK